MRHPAQGAVDQGSSSSSMSPSIRSATSSSSSSSSSRKVSSAGFVVLDLDIVVDDGGDLLVAGIGLFERDELDARGRLGLVFLLVVLARAARWARGSGALEDGPALRADDRILVQIEEFRAAVLALALGAEFRFRHCLSIPELIGSRWNVGGAPLVGSQRPCQMRIRAACRQARRAVLRAPRRRAPCYERVAHDQSRLARPRARAPRTRRARSSAFQPPRRRRCTGRVRPPGDKSISHRALIFGLLCRSARPRSRACSKATTCCAPARPAGRSAPRSSGSATGAWRVAGVGVGSLLHAARRARFRQCRHRLAPDDGRRRRPRRSPRPSTATPRCASGRCGASSIRSR